MPLKVSIIVPVYNVEECIELCVKSIIRQTLKEIEMILVDDGSTDRSGEICDQFAKEDTRIKVLHKENGGLSDARNQGLKLATGVYVGFVDSDDSIDKNMFETLYTACKENETEVSMCKYLVFHDGFENNIIPCDPSALYSTVLTVNDAFKIMSDVRENVRMTVWNKLYLRELFQTVEFPKGKLYEDVATTYKLVFQAKKIAYIEAELYNYRVGRQGAIMSSKYDSRKEQERILMTEQMSDYINENYPELNRWAVAYQCATADLSVINSMVKSRNEDPEMIYFLRQRLKKRSFGIFASKLNLMKKVQIATFIFSFQAYKFFLKKIGEKKSYRKRC